MASYCGQATISDPRAIQYKQCKQLPRTHHRSPAIRCHTLSGIARTSMCVAVRKVKLDANDRANSSAPCGLVCCYFGQFPCHCRNFNKTSIVCHHFIVLMSTFQGHVACQHLPLTLALLYSSLSNIQIQHSNVQINP